jgi:hypothetical protein
MAKKKKPAKKAKRKKASAKDLKARKDVRGGLASLASTRLTARRPLGFT